jgi:hypothetical protein
MSAKGRSDTYGFAGLVSLVSDLKVPPSIAGKGASSSSDTKGSGEATTSVSVVHDRDFGRGPVVLIIIGGVILWVAYAHFNDNSANGPTAPTASPVSPPSYSSGDSAAPRYAPSKNIDLATPNYLETEPAPGSGSILTVREITYCLAQDSRIATVQPLIDRTSHTAIVGFNAAVENFNSRCGHYRYKEEDMSQATSAVKAHQAEIDGQAQQWLAAWQGPKRRKNASN